MRFKRLTSILIVLLMLFIPTNVFSGNAFDKQDNIYKYSITPDSEEWSKYEPAELYKLLDIPEYIVKEMNTEALLLTVLDYPYIGDINAFNSYDLGIQRVSERFSGLSELIGRSDAADVLYKHYLSTSNKVTSAKHVNNIDSDIIKYRAMNAMLSSTYFYDKFDKTQINDIKQASSAISKVINVSPIDAMDTPYATRATVKTPNGTSVYVFSNPEFTINEIKEMDKYVASRYPSASKIRSASNRYNCHSYAWYSTSSSNPYWMNDPSAYMKDGSYSNVGFYPTAVNQKLFDPYNNHSGIIYKTGSSVYTVEITSKWGEYGLYRHVLYYGPYASGAPNYSCWTR